jgi:hypothetical protein
MNNDLSSASSVTPSGPKTEDCSAATGNGNAGAIPAKKPLPLFRFVREESAWSWRAWIFFGCALVFCTVEGIPTWTHPDLRFDIPLGTCFLIIGIAGAATGWVVAPYRLAGLVAGAIAGSGSLLAAVFVFQGFTQFPRYPVVLVEFVGLLPGVVLYMILHIIIDRLRPPTRPAP